MTVAEETLVVYKCLTPAGASQYQGWQWPLPGEDGSPGDWVEESEAVMCRRGFHGYLTLAAARAQGTFQYEVYEMELAGTIVRGDRPLSTPSTRDKACATRARLLRKVWDRNGEVVRLADLVWQ